MFIKNSHLGQIELNRQGQSIAEYTMFISVMVLALLAMQIFLKRGIQGKIKDMADEISSEAYAPNWTYANYYSNRIVSYETVVDGGFSNTTLGLEQINRTGREEAIPEWVVGP